MESLLLLQECSCRGARTRRFGRLVARMSKDPNRVEHYFSSSPQSYERFGLVRTSLCGKPFEFLTASSVFSKRKVDCGTRLLVESMVLSTTGYVLDIGCGYGVVGISVAKFNPKLHVVMTDVNARAVRLAKKNLTLNKVACLKLSSS